MTQREIGLFRVTRSNIVSPDKIRAIPERKRINIRKTRENILRDLSLGEHTLGKKDNLYFKLISLLYSVTIK